MRLRSRAAYFSTIAQARYRQRHCRRACRCTLLGRCIAAFWLSDERSFERVASFARNWRVCAAVHFGYRGREPHCSRRSRRFASTLGRGACHALLCVHVGLSLPPVLQQWHCSATRECVLASRGGYVGSGIAWALLQLFGEAVSIALLLGVALAGAVIIGFSLTGAFEVFAKGSQFNARLRAVRDAEDDRLLAFLTKLSLKTNNPMLRLTKIGLRRRSSLPRLASLVAKSAACLPASA